ncbi:ROK family protein, partial [Streptomyces griseus]|uniref:ROK family protein n=1 Tax=Streptomyces griseus TaxID=1911 RepID=UPI0033FCBBB3
GAGLAEEEVLGGGVENEGHLVQTFRTNAVGRERAAQALAAGIAATATLADLDIAVVGGGVAGAGDVLFVPLRRSLREYATLSYLRRLTVAPAVMGTDAGLVGAAAAAIALR